MTRAVAANHSSAGDAIDRALDRLWGRTGLRFMLVMIAFGEFFGWTVAAVAEVLVCRYLEIPATDVIRLLAWSGAILVASVVLTVAIAARAARPLTTISAASSEDQQRQAEEITDALLRACFAVLWIFVFPAHLALFVQTLHPDLPTFVLLVIGGAELAMIIAWLALIFVPPCGRVVRNRVQAVTGRKVAVLTKSNVRSKMILAIAPPSLAGSSFGMLIFVQPGVPPGQLLAQVVVMKLVILAFLCVAAPLLARSVTLPLHELTDGAERLKRADFSKPVPELASDEFGVLARTLNDAMAGMADRQRLAAELQASRARIVAAADESRRRIERNIHDGAQQRLVALALDVRMLKEQAAALSTQELFAALDRTGDELKTALSELRELARGLHPSILTTDGLGPAIEQLASRSSIPVVVDVAQTRFPEAVETACYFTVAEALANVAKYAEASEAAVRITQSDGHISLRVSDNGVGGADPAAGSGLTGLVDRIAALDGTLTVDSPVGVGTTITVALPIAEQTGLAELRAVTEPPAPEPTYAGKPETSGEDGKARRQWL